MIHKIKHLTFTILVLVIIPAAIFGADDSISNSELWTHFTTSNGLPYNEIKQVLEDEDGSLLVVTANSGIFRYDGQRFSPLAINDQLPTLFIQWVVKDKQNRLWITCNYSGVWIYDHEKLYPFQFNHLFRKQHFVTIYCDTKGKIWIDVNRVGLFYYDGDKCVNLTRKFNLPDDDILQIGQKEADSYYLLFRANGLHKFSFFSENHLSPAMANHTEIIGFLIDESSNVWLMRKSKGVYLSSANEENLIFECDHLEQDESYSIIEDSGSRIWFSTRDIIYCYQKDELKSFRISHSKYCRPFQDRFQNVWFAASSGLYKFINSELKSWSLPNSSNKNQMRPGFFQCNQFLFKSSTGRIWFADKDLNLYYFERGKVFNFKFPDSLASIDVIDIAEDKQAQIWFGTRKDGIFNLHEDSLIQSIPVDSLPGEFVTSLYVDSKNRVWIGCISALPHLTYLKSWQNTIRHSNEMLTSKSQLNITSLYVDQENGVWYGSLKNSIIYSNQNIFKKIKARGINLGNLTNIQNIYKKENELWGTSSWGVFKHNTRNSSISFFRNPALVREIFQSPFYDEFNWVTGDFFHCNSIYLLEEFKDYKKDPAKPIYNISSYYKETSGDLWVGSFSVGLFFINKEKTIRFDSNRGLPSHKISTVQKDSNGNLWVGTLDKGLFLWQDSVFVQHKWMKDAGKSISCFFEDKRKRFWIGSLDNGLVQMKNNQCFHFNNKTQQTRVWAIGENDAGDIYVSLKDGYFGRVTSSEIEILPPDEIHHNHNLRQAFENRTINFRDAFLAPKRKISSGLICWDGKNIKRYSVEQGLPGHEITDIVETRDGKLWISTLNTGVAVLENDRFQPVVNSEIDRLTRMTVLHATRDSALWILTNGEGLGYIKGDSTKVWGSESKIITISAQNIKTDGQNNLIVSNVIKFNYFNDGDIQPFPDFAIYNPGETGIMPFFFIDSLDQVWFNTTDRKLNSYKIKKIAPIVSIKSCQLGNDLFDETQIKKTIHRDYNDKACVIEYFGYHSSFPAQNLKYSYRVIKDDAPGNWSQPTNQDRLIYTELEPGKSHTFQIRAKTPNGLYSNDLASVSIDLAKTPVYLEAWFFWVMLSLAAILIALYFIFRLYRIKRIITRRRFNPYIAGEPIFDQDLFFGREKILNQVLTIIHNNSIMITGERRIGKTSFLIQLKKELAASRDPDLYFIPIFLDLQGVHQWEFFYSLISDVAGQTEDVTKTLKLRARKKKDTYNYRDFNSDFRKIIKRLTSESQKKIKLVLLIDEADAMNGYDQVIHAQLRRIFMQDFSLNFAAVISGTHYIQTWNRPESPWWNLFTLIELKPLSEPDAKKLIQDPVKGIFKFRDDALDNVLEKTACKPYLIQQLCISLVNHALDEQRRIITLEDVEFVIKQSDFIINGVTEFHGSN